MRTLNATSSQRDSALFQNFGLWSEAHPDVDLLVVGRGHLTPQAEFGEPDIAIVFGQTYEEYNGRTISAIDYRTQEGVVNAADVFAGFANFPDGNTYYDLSTFVRLPSGFEAVDVGLRVADGYELNYRPLVIDRESMTLRSVSDPTIMAMKWEIWERILDYMLSHLGDPDERQQPRVERGVAALTEYFREGATVEMRNLRDEIGSLMRNLAEYERNVTTVKDSLRSKQLHLDMMLQTAGATDAAAEAADAFARMQDYPQIETATMSGRTLVIHTTGLDIEHPETGETGYLGKFEVGLNIADGSVKIRNLDNARSGFDHPHVNHGSICFGEMDNAIMDAVRSGRLLAAVDLIFVFLSTANVRDDWGRSIAYWIGEQVERPAPLEAVTA